VHALFNPRQALTLFLIDEAFYRLRPNTRTYDNKSDGPVDDSILEYIPEIVISETMKIPEDKEDCVICLEKIKNGDVAIMLACTHIFHRDCIFEWFKTNDLCPICKYKVCKEDYEVKE
jgi:hypothetical protein